MSNIHIYVCVGLELCKEENPPFFILFIDACINQLFFLVLWDLMINFYAKMFGLCIIHVAAHRQYKPWPNEWKVNWTPNKLPTKVVVIRF